MHNVLHILNSSGGGAALSTIGIIERLAAEGITSCAVCHDGGTEEERSRLLEVTSGRTTFTPLYWWNRKTRATTWKRPLLELHQQVATGFNRRSEGVVRRVAEAESPDLIHTNTILTPVGGVIAERLRLPHVWHLREMLGPGNPYELRLRGPALRSHLERRCSKLIANSEASAATIRADVPPGMLEVVPNGIDVDAFDPTARREAAGTVEVGMVGNLTSRWKKHGLFVEAAGLVDPELPVRWRIVGHDPSAGGTIARDPYVDGLLARVRSLGLEDRFVLAGFQTDVPAVMAGLDILVHPADGESFGRVVVEAMAAGRPVVGVRGGGVGSIVEDERTGLLADADDAAGIAAAVERLVKQPELRARLGCAGRALAEEQYSLDRCAQRVLEVYRQALDRPLGLPRR